VLLTYEDRVQSFDIVSLNKRVQKSGTAYSLYVPQGFLDSKEINSLSKRKEKTRLARYFRVSETPAFHASDPVMPVKKSVFDNLPYPKRGLKCCHPHTNLLLEIE